MTLVCAAPGVAPAEPDQNDDGENEDRTSRRHEPGYRLEAEIRAEGHGVMIAPVPRRAALSTPIATITPSALIATARVSTNQVRDVKSSFRSWMPPGSVHRKRDPGAGLAIPTTARRSSSASARLEGPSARVPRSWMARRRVQSTAWGSASGSPEDPTITSLAIDAQRLPRAVAGKRPAILNGVVLPGHRTRP